MASDLILALSKRDAVNMALAISASATSAYLDERLTTSATDHALAARLWALAGYDAKARTHRTLAYSIDREAIEARFPTEGEDEDS